VYVAVDCSRSVGYIAGHLTTRFACDGEVQWLYVAQGARHAGVATALLRRLMDWFVAHGAARVCVDVAPHNAAARRLYARAGAVALNRAWMVWEDVAMSRDTAAR
jgi:ribosomal protein S18 acetylase RimI-like enzyme